MRTPDFRRLWIGDGLSMLGSHFTDLALPLLVLKQTGSPVLAGLVGTVRMLAYLTVHLPAGALADRLRRRPVMLAADAIWATITFSIGLALVIGRPLGTLALMILAVTGTLLSSVSDPAGQAATRHVVGRGDMTAAIGLNTVRNQTLGLIAPVLGGLAYQIAPALPFLLDAASYAASFVLVLLVRTPLGGGRAGQQAASLWSDILTGMRFLWRSHFLRLYLAWAALANFATGGVLFALVLVVIPLGGTTLGVALATVSIAGLAGAAVASRVSRLDIVSYFALACLVRLLLAIAMVISPTPLVLTVGMALMALLGATISIPLNARIYAAIPDHLMGRVQSAMTLLGGALYPFAGVLTGWLSGQVTMSGALLFLALMFGGALALSLTPSLRKPSIAVTIGQPMRVRRHS